MSESGSWYRLTDNEKLEVIQQLPARLESLQRGELGGFQRGPYEDE